MQPTGVSGPLESWHGCDIEIGSSYGEYGLQEQQGSRLGSNENWQRYGRSDGRTARLQCAVWQWKVAR